MLKNIFMISSGLIQEYWLFMIIVAVSWSIIYRLNTSESFVKLFMFDNIEKLYSCNMQTVIESIMKYSSPFFTSFTRILARFLVFHSRKAVIIIELYYIISLFVNAGKYRILVNTTKEEIIAKALCAGVTLYLIIFLLFLMGCCCKLLKTVFKLHKELVEEEIKVADKALQLEMNRLKKSKRSIRKRRNKMDKNVRGMEHDVDIRESMENVPNYDDNNYSTEDKEENSKN